MTPLVVILRLSFKFGKFSLTPNAACASRIGLSMSHRGAVFQVCTQVYPKYLHALSPVVTHCQSVARYPHTYPKYCHTYSSMSIRIQTVSVVVTRDQVYPSVSKMLPSVSKYIHVYPNAREHSLAPFAWNWLENLYRAWRTRPQTFVTWPDGALAIIWSSICLGLVRQYDNNLSPSISPI